MNASFYYLLLLVCVGFSLWASVKVNGNFKKYSNIPAARGVTGFSAARALLDERGLPHVQVLPTAGHLSDHFDPRNNTVYLSESVYHSNGCAAVGVACHEAGHAIQHAEHYAPAKLRTAIVPATNFAARLAPLLILAGLALSYTAPDWIVLAYVGILGFAAAAFFQLVTLRSEFDASSRALAGIRRLGLAEAEQIGACKKVLSAAALTYVAALATSLVQMLRMLAIVSGSDRRRR